MIASEHPWDEFQKIQFAIDVELDKRPTPWRLFVCDGKCELRDATGAPFSLDIGAGITIVAAINEFAKRRKEHA